MARGETAVGGGVPDAPIPIGSHSQRDVEDAVPYEEHRAVSLPGVADFYARMGLRASARAFFCASASARSLPRVVK